MARANKSTGKSLVKWDEEFADLAKQSSKGAKVQEGKFLSFKSGNMTFAGADIPDNELSCVIVGWCHHNVYYDPNERYDPENPQSPICYAFGTDEAEMEPHEDAKEHQCGSCAECPFNEWESAKQGKGKACKNTVRLALIAESDLDDLENAEVVYASIPPTSVKNWLMYLTKELRDRAQRPHWAVITLLSLKADNKSQFKVTFQNAELIEDSELFQPLKELWEAQQEAIGFPYVVSERPERATKKTTRKSSTRKKQKFSK